MTMPLISLKSIRTLAIIVMTALTVSACATIDVVADKSRRFDQATAAYDAGDYAGAYTIWRELADENDLAAMRNTAHLFRRGLGVDKNPEKALDLYTEAARKGLVLAMANVAEMHLNGEGTLKDPEEAARWYTLAANGGLSIAMMKLGEMHEQGLGVPKDNAKAQENYLRAARNGYAPAQKKLSATGTKAAALTADTAHSGSEVQRRDPFRGSVSSAPIVEPDDVAATKAKLKSAPAAKSEAAITPPPVPQQVEPLGAIDPAVIGELSGPDAQRLQAGYVAFQAGQQSDAFKLWRGLAEKGVADAQFRVGYLFERGMGVGQDVIEAYRWYKLGAARNNTGATTGLARISQKLSPAERAIAESLGASAQKPGTP